MNNMFLRSLLVVAIVEVSSIIHCTVKDRETVGGGLLIGLLVIPSVAAFLMWERRPQSGIGGSIAASIVPSAMIGAFLIWAIIAADNSDGVSDVARFVLEIFLSGTIVGICTLVITERTKLEPH